MVTPVDQRRWNSWSTEDLPWNVTGIVFTISLLIGCFTASALAAQPPNASTASHEAANHELSVAVTGFSFSGNAAIGEEELLSLIEDAIGGELTLADLEALSDRIGDYYRGQGYLLARAYLPPQTIEGGRVQIAVDEGRYADVSFENQSRLHPDTARQFFRSLKPGTAIRRQPLERSLRLVSDLPGVRVHSVLRPGTSPGTSDLIVALEDGQMLTGRVAVDNHGNRYAGHNRLSFQLALENPWGRARRITLGGVSSGTELLSGALTYETGLGGNGLRAEISYSLVEYRLGGAMAQLDATGRVESFSASLRYPWIRSEAANWIGRIEASAASLRDWIGSVDLVTQKGVYKLMLSISGDRAMGRAGRAGGSITLTYGDLSVEVSRRTGHRRRDGADGGPLRSPWLFRTVFAIARITVDRRRFPLEGNSPPKTSTARRNSRWAELGAYGPTRPERRPATRDGLAGWRCGVLWWKSEVPALSVCSCLLNRAVCSGTTRRTWVPETRIFGA